MKNNIKLQEQAKELNLENMAISIEQAQIVQGDELQMVTGGQTSKYSMGGNCELEMTSP